MTRTYLVTHRGATSTLSGDVTAASRGQAIAAASVAWNVVGHPSEWSAVVKPEQERAELEARHRDMDETAEALA